MERSVRSVVVFVAVSTLIACHSTEAWYKQPTGPSYYSVGRASGLLSGIRRSYVRRSQEQALGQETTDPTGNSVPDLLGQQTPVLKNMAVCVKDISPSLRSCELVADGSSVLRCKADVFISLNALDCLD
ncbi:neuropeptide B-like [Engraulis encrasicolus]|uniref:neuropeptide B-like n=1 Tax=Engraulis encrasicolus TaxID=184585 RepID=UPI002FD45BC7